MATNTYVELKKVTLVSSASLITFDDIPQTYTDLRLVGSFNSSGYAVGGLQYNGVTSGYSTTFNYGVTSQRTTSQNKILFQQGYGPIIEANSFQIVNVDIMNYANTTTKKTTLWKTGNPTSTGFPGYEWGVGLHPSTSAITSIVFDAGGTNVFQSGSTFSLYGVRAEGVSPAVKATGGVIYSDSTHYYHVFASSGTLTPTQSLTADVLVVAGGGGSGRTGGGGGAGGLRGLTAQSLGSGTNYTITIGGGGAGATSDGSVATNGVNSSVSGSGFSTITASGGGGGNSFSGNNATAIGASGGSGGGGGTADGVNATRTGGAGNTGGFNPVEGFAGGNGVNSRGSGGGGGATAVGANAPSTNNGGAGGIGSAAFSAYGVATGTGQSSGGVHYYAGGGGGSGLSANGTGGLGGGGTGNTVGTINTGGGAGGANDVNGKTGGSGIVIVRYLKA